jgi:hypothetical protein
LLFFHLIPPKWEIIIDLQPFQLPKVAIY